MSLLQNYFRQEKRQINKNVFSLFLFHVSFLIFIYFKRRGNSFKTSGIIDAFIRTNHCFIIVSFKAYLSTGWGVRMVYRLATLKEKTGEQSSNSGRVRYSHIRIATVGKGMDLSLLPPPMG